MQTFCGFGEFWGGFLKCERGLILCIAIQNDLALYDATEKLIFLFNHINMPRNLASTLFDMLQKRRTIQINQSKHVSIIKSYLRSEASLVPDEAKK